MVAAWCSGGFGCLVVPGDDGRFAVDLGELRVLGTVPSEGATGVASDAVIDVCFDAILDPTTLDPRAAQLFAGSALFDSSLEPMLVAWRAPGEREGLAPTRWCPGSVLRVTPVSPLRPLTSYRVRLDTSVTGWSGEPLLPEGEGWINDRGEPALVVSFFTAPAPEASPRDLDPRIRPTLEPPRLTDLFQVGGPFDPQRDTCSCHRDEGSARDLLDLTSVAQAEASLLRGATAPLVIPGRPAESRLLHVALRDGAGASLPGPRSGEMPPADSGRTPWTHEDVTLVSAWIAAGAMP